MLLEPHEKATSCLLLTLVPGPITLMSACPFFFNDTATTEIYTLSLHDALPISGPRQTPAACRRRVQQGPLLPGGRSEEHTSELQSHSDLVCRLLLEKKKQHESRVRWNADGSRGPPFM